MGEIELDKSIYKMDDLLVEGLESNILMKESSSASSSVSILPVFLTKNLKITENMLKASTLYSTPDADFELHYPSLSGLILSSSLSLKIAQPSQPLQAR